MQEVIERATGSRRHPSAVLVALAVLPGAAFLLVFLVRSRIAGELGSCTLLDDAMISMAFGRTWSQTGELLWFPGAERVQGFTNPLWTGVMALVHLFGFKGSSASLIVSLLSIALILGRAVLVVLVTFQGINHTWRFRTLTALTAGAVVPFLYSPVFWAVRGMEVGLLAFLALLLIVVLAGISNSWLEGSNDQGLYVSFTLVAILGIATRLDFIVIVGGLGILLWVWAPSRQIRNSLLARIALPIALASLIILGAQYAYFGDWLPNTYSLKVEGFGVIERVERGLFASAKVLPVAVLTALSLAVVIRSDLKQQGKRVATALAMVWFVTLTYGIWVGGDAWEWSNISNRYVAVGLPAACAVAFLGLAAMVHSPRRYMRVVALGLPILGLCAIGYGWQVNPITFDGALALRGAAAIVVTYGVLLALWAVLRLRPHDAVIAVGIHAAAAAVIVAVTSFIPGSHWLEHGGTHVYDDYVITEQSLAVRDVTTSDAVIATVWAGAPGYYMERRMIDILGKNDRQIARQSPNTMAADSPVATLYPGHNKWNYDYSIGEQRPDVVFQLWNPTSEDLAKLDAWGYQKYCRADGSVSAYFLTQSPHILWDQIRACDS